MSLKPLATNTHIETRTVVDPETDCWLWTGYICPAGYGKLGRGGFPRFVHRLAYEEWIGPIPEGMTIDHLCRVRRCCFPGHLEAVSLAVNILRGESYSALNSRKTHCPKGHEYTPENIYTFCGRRVCRTCHRDKTRRQREAKKQSP